MSADIRVFAGQSFNQVVGSGSGGMVVDRDGAVEGREGVGGCLADAAGATVVEERMSWFSLLWLK